LGRSDEALRGVAARPGLDAGGAEILCQRVAIAARAEADGAGLVEGVGERFGVWRALQLGGEPVGQRVAVGEGLWVGAEVRERVEQARAALGFQAAAPQADTEERLGADLALGGGEPAVRAEEAIEHALRGSPAEDLFDGRLELEAVERGPVDRADAVSG
jgi:hypothetical protein